MPRARSRPTLVQPARRVDLATVGTAWWSALDAAETALHASARVLAAGELRSRSVQLAHERASTVSLLEEVARAERNPARFRQLLVSRANLRRLLGLPAGVTACIFNLDGVLIESASLHAGAWSGALDPFLLAHSELTGGGFAPFDRFAPFDPRWDYRAYLHGKPRLEGLRAFLASRGVSLSEGGPLDPAGAETVYGLARRKHEILLRRLEHTAVIASAGSRRYLESAREASMRCAVVSTSASTGPTLEGAGIASLVDEQVDGAAIVSGRLRPRPAPDIVLAACRLLGAPPDRTAVFETSADGVGAARAAGCRFVVGVDAQSGGALRSAGADLVVDSLSELLDRPVR